MRMGVLLLALLMGCQPKSSEVMEAAAEVSGEATGVDGITADRLEAHVQHLATDAFNGRETGTEDVKRAAEYLAEQLSGLGLKPLPGDEDLFADYTLYRRGYAKDTALALQVGDEAVDTALGGNWRPFPFSDPGEVEAEVVFAGYGITAPEHGWDDYEGLDVEGKIVLILRHEPGEADEDSPFAGIESSEYSTFLSKAMNAVEHGAVGYLLVTDPMHHEDSDDLRVNGALALDPPEIQGGESQGPPFRAAQISRSVAEALMASTGKSLQEAQQAIEGGAKPKDIVIDGAKAKLGIAMLETADEVPERNVVAYLEGSESPDEWVVIGAHYDHVGGYKGEGDTVFNGADDNASGTSGMLELARAFATGERPKRSIVFMGYSGEEKGLLGSRAWVRDHGVDNVVFMLNLDMIGRNPELDIDVVGDGYGTGITEAVTEAVNKAGLEKTRITGAEYFGASDHDSFYREGVPFLFFFTGIHEDYHQLGDHADKLSYDRMEKIVKAGYHLVEPIANKALTPQFIHHVGWLGSTISAGEVLNVEEGSRGAEAGLQAGDIVLGIGEERFEAADAGQQVSTVEPGSTVMLVVKRGEAEESIEVQRAKTGYLGIFPGMLSDEQRSELGLVDDTGVLVNQAAEGGPAEKSGLKAGDVILQIAGNPVSNRSLTKVLQRIGAGEKVNTLVLRDGERVTIELVLGERPQR